MNAEWKTNSRPCRARPRIAAALISICVVALAAGPVSAAPADHEARSYIECRQALAAASAENIWLGAEIIHLRAEAAFLATHPVRTVAPLNLLETNTAQLAQTLEQKIASDQTRTSADVAAWQQVREARLQGNEPAGVSRFGRLAPRTVAALGLAGMVVLANCGCLAVLAYCGRRWVRRRVTGGSVTVFAGILAAALLIGFGSVAVWPGLAQAWPAKGSPDGAADELPALQAELNAAQAAVRQNEQAYAQIKGQWEHAALTAKPDGQPLADEWLGLRATLRSAAVADATLRSAVEGLQAERTQLAQQQAAAESNADRPRERLLATAALSSACCLWGVAAIAVWLSSRRSAAVCPKCNTTGRLKSVKLGSGQPGRVLKDVVCEAKWDGRNVCSFRMPSEHRRATRLCYPIIGIPASGKTHWLAAAYDRLMNETYPTHLDFHHVETRGSAELDRLVARLHAGQRQLEANQVTLPDPVVFRFSDQGKFAQSQALVNLFDYSGEVFRMLDLDCPLRRRMLHADGMLLFLDPVDGPEAQLHEFKRFLNDADRHSLNVPGAVCVTKVDLLLGGQPLPEVGYFQQQLREVEARRWRGCGDAAAIEARSEATAGLLRALWPQVDLDRMLEKMFPGKFRYFPLTSVGIGRATDPPDPQWVLEPLLWLLARSGFDVFTGRSRSIPAGGAAGHRVTA